MSLKNITYTGFIFFCILYLSGCRDLEKKSAIISSNPIKFIRYDTTYARNFVSINQVVHIDSFDIQIVNIFTPAKDSSLSIPNWKKTIVILDNDTINSLRTFSDKFCKENSSHFFAKFDGDSIDNLSGFNYSKISTDTSSFYVLKGYFEGCNGRFCDNKELLVLFIDNKSRKRVYLTGFNHSLVDFDKVRFYPKYDGLVADASITINDRTEEISLLFQENIQISKGIKLTDLNYIFFCVK